MSQVKVISLDAEGTLVTPDFSHTVWHEAIPALYAQRYGIELSRAKEVVTAEYDKIGECRLEWYDIGYWLDYFDLGPSEPLIQRCQNKSCCYPEVREVLSSLAVRYSLIVSSGTPEELLLPQLEDISSYFARIFSSTSHCGQLKNPDFYLYVCDAMHVELNELVHVGDNWQFDFVNPRKVGIRAFHLDRSGNSRESLVDLTQLEPYLLA
jgi:putative hydrolase of the HAD superfamily